MKVMEINGFGDETVFKLATHTIPHPGPDQILVRNLATSVNPLDTKIRRGLFTAILPELPAILQGDSAGIVESVGENISEFKKGDKVFGYCGGFKGFPGALAEYSIFQKEWVAPCPQNIGFYEAAALPLAGITAWMAVMERIKLMSNHSILIHGGTGGVGHLAVQIAKTTGAKVFTTVSNEFKEEIACGYELAGVINYKKESVDQYISKYTQGEGFDFVFDTVGGEVLKNSLVAIKPGGTVLSIAARSVQDLTPLHTKGASLAVVFMLAPLLYHNMSSTYASILRNIKDLVEREKLIPLVHPEIFELEQIALAHKLLEEGKAVGKVVVKIPLE